jgi:peptidyl-prolyl cis-trans isomerase SurA
MTDISSARPGVWPGLRAARLSICALALLVTTGACLAQGRTAVRNGDYILVVVNQELVTAGEVDQRLERTREAATRSGQRPAPEPDLRKQVLDSLIDERVVVTYARDGGTKVEELELDRAVQNVATQNQLTLEQLRARLKEEGLDYGRFRANLRDQILVERVREREVYQRIRITDGEIDRFVDKQRADAQADAEYNVAQILVTLPENADATTTAARRERADQALARVSRGEAFERVAREVSEDGNRDKGGEIGMRPASRLPDLFVDAVRSLQPGTLAAAVVRSGAGFHVLRLLDRREGAALRVTQTRARHILLRPSDQLSAEVASRRLAEFKRQIESKSKSFEELAREASEDGSASAGGDLGWVSPGALVPEFEEAMNRLVPGAMSPPVVSRFGVHLIQVVERRDVPLETKQLREQARNVLREQKFEETYTEWAKDLRARAYIEMREPPL